MSSIDEKRYEKTGELTPDLLMTSSLKEMREQAREGNPPKRVVLVVLYEDQEIKCGFTDGSALEKIGMLEYGKTFLFNEIDMDE